MPLPFISVLKDRQLKIESLEKQLNTSITIYPHFALGGIITILTKEQLNKWMSKQNI